MTTYSYPDAYLAKYATEDREARAISDVALMTSDRVISANWLRRLTILQVYVLACLENQADTEDLFTAKLKSYRDEMKTALPAAIADADAAAENVSTAYICAVSRS
jgi:hypothetical protein